nr:uncharacterized protein LOC109182027 isoform X2 [Ipomoea batatas]
MSLKTQMVAKMMKWCPWPPLISKKLEVRQVVRRLENLCGGDDSLSCGATVKKDISNYDRMNGRRDTCRELCMSITCPGCTGPSQGDPRLVYVYGDS